MGRFTRGSAITDIETAVFCIQANDHIYFASHLLPTAQYWSWPLAKIRTAVNEGKLFYAEVTP